MALKQKKGFQSLGTGQWQVWRATLRAQWDQHMKSLRTASEALLPHSRLASRPQFASVFSIVATCCLFASERETIDVPNAQAVLGALSLTL
eukprot:4661545-Amphidinium_carterae.1